MGPADGTEPSVMLCRAPERMKEGRLDAPAQIGQFRFRNAHLKGPDRLSVTVRSLPLGVAVVGVMTCSFEAV